MILSGIVHVIIRRLHKVGYLPFDFTRYFIIELLIPSSSSWHSPLFRLLQAANNLKAQGIVRWRPIRRTLAPSSPPYDSPDTRAVLGKRFTLPARLVQLYIALDIGKASSPSFD